MRLTAEAVSGVKWSSFSSVTQQGIQLLTVIVLAKLLSPSDFGLIGMAGVFIGFVGLFKDLGTAAAVIQRKTLSDELLSSIFWVNVVLGFLAMLALFGLSPLAALLFREPRVTPLMMLLSLTFMISGLSIMQQAILQREMLFRQLAKVEIGAAVTGSMVAIGTALRGAGVWSLVYQSLAVTAATTILLWGLSGWRPRLVFHWTEVRSVGSYSLNLTGFSIVNYFIRNADYLLIGRFLGAQDLGYYTLAYRMVLDPIKNLSAVIGRVMFPAYSKVQDDLARFRQAYLKVVSAIALISFPAMAGVLMTSDYIVFSFLGPEWAPVVLLLMIFAPVGLLQSIGGTTGAIYQARGRTDWMFRWGLAAGVVILIAFTVGLQWGIVGVATAYLVAVMLLVYPGYAIPFRIIHLNVRELGVVLWRPLSCMLIMVLALLLLRALLPAELSGGAALGLLIIIGVVTYLSANWLLNRDQVRQTLDLVGMRLS